MFLLIKTCCKFLLHKLDDAWPSNPFTRGNQSHQPVAAMPVERDAEHYNMNHKRRGLAFIFNHKVSLNNKNYIG